MRRKRCSFSAHVLSLGLLLLPPVEASGNAETPPLRLHVVPPEQPPTAGKPLRVRVIVEASPEVTRWPILVTAHAEGETLQPALGRYFRAGAKPEKQHERRAPQWPWRISWPLLARRAGAGIVRFEALGYVCRRHACRAIRAGAELSLRVR